jgi:hypothetical protein
MEATNGMNNTNFFVASRLCDFACDFSVWGVVKFGDRFGIGFTQRRGDAKGREASGFISRGGAEARSREASGLVTRGVQKTLTVKIPTAADETSLYYVVLLLLTLIK